MFNFTRPRITGCRGLTFLTLLACFLPAATAQVPQLISYQGHVTIAGANFNGTGQFKFAFVSGDGSTSWWSNDGSSAGGSEPSTIVHLGVTNGLFSVALGDPALGMTAIPPAVFTNTDVRLRIWFNDGAHGDQLLSPDQRLTASGYAMMAANAAVASSVPAGSITGTMLGANTVTAANLASGTAAANLQASGQSAVPSDGMILSTNPSSANLLNAGYVNIGQFGSITNNTDGSGGNESWQATAPASPPSVRTDHSAIWTGSNMIVWGGYNGTNYLNTGGIYDPSANSWSAPAASSLPGRSYQVALWTGSQMLIWGGYLGGTNYANSGSRYNPSANSWSAMTTNGAPSGRDVPAAVWTGTEIIIWGGYNSGVNGGGAFLFDGARYNPASDSWTQMNTSGAPPARQFPAAVWTGTQMIIWGGYGDQDYLNDGWRYDPGTDTWTAIATNGAPSARFLHSVVWTGSQMIVWGGVNAGGFLNDGGCYTPASDTWAPVTTGGAPSGRKFHSAVWMGTEMIIWGGYNNTGNLQDGGRYNPFLNSWRATISTGAPAARENHSAIWTGSQMLIWGGDASGTTYFNDLSEYSPGGGGSATTQSVYLYLKQ
jgi:N-acetylneuraminic acid mutarotase